jgi:hypothetical protein
VLSNEDPILNLNKRPTVTVTFNRDIDTVVMKALGAETFIGIYRNVDTIASTIAFAPNMRTILVTPVDTLLSSTDYFVKIKNIPACGIYGAAAIHNNAGTISGKTEDNYLISRGFQVQ